MRFVISRPLGRKQTVVVQELADRHVAKADARALYEDRTPKPTEEEIEMRRLTRLAHAFTPVRSPARQAGAPANPQDERGRLGVR